MFLQEPGETQFDWRFRLFAIPVRVHPLFWLVSVILGFSAVTQNPGPTGFLYLAMWVACVFVSILAHELGHIFAGQMFGSDGHIVLYSFGGLAIRSSDVSTHWRRIFISFAGPLAGFCLFAIVAMSGCLYSWELVVNVMRSVVGLDWFRDDWPLWLEKLVFDLFWINLFWGLINLLPIWPLDGGQISQQLFQKYSASNGVRRCLILSIVTAAFFAVNGLMGEIQKKPFVPFLPQGDWYQAVFFAILAFMSWQLLQQPSAAGGRLRMEDERYERAPWEQDADWWKRG
jgi:Zn-dependent protease